VLYKTGENGIMASKVLQRALPFAWIAQNKMGVRSFWMEGHRMDLQNMDLKGGSLQISTEVIGKIARCAALEIEGVAEVSCGKQNRKVKDLLERANVQSPVTVEMRDGTAEITLEIVAAFGARIPAVAEKVQENVKSAVQNMTNVTVSRVDLVIAGLAPAAEPQA
jgi:uncharacterized alkaline shock family protein YloU